MYLRISYLIRRIITFSIVPGLLLLMLGSSAILLCTSVVPADAQVLKLESRLTDGLVEESLPDPLIITSPGPGSRVNTPLKIRADLDLEDGVVLLVELRGYDGRLLVRHLHLKGLTVGDSLDADFIFQIRDPEEAGRLLLISRDVHGRTVAVNSVDLVLSDGNELIQPASNIGQSIQILEPFPGSVESGGNVIVSGMMRTETDGPLHVQLVAEDGGVIGQRLAGTVSDPGKEFQVFTVEVPYSVSAATPVRVIVYEDGGEISPVRHLSSREVILEP